MAEIFVAHHDHRAKKQVDVKYTSPSVSLCSFSFNPAIWERPNKVWAYNEMGKGLTMMSVLLRPEDERVLYVLYLHSNEEPVTSEYVK